MVAFKKEESYPPKYYPATEDAKLAPGLYVFRGKVNDLRRS